MLVNDGSRDSSSEICNRYAAQYARVHVLHQKNAGVSAARNAGIEYLFSELAYVDYVAFLDSDDLWAPDFFDLDIVNLIRNGDDLFGFQSCSCNSQASLCSKPALLKEGTVSGGSKNVWIHASQPFAAMLYSSNLIRKFQTRFREGLKYGEDNIFRMQCMYLANTISLRNKVLYYYRHSAVSAVHSRKYGIHYFPSVIDGWLESDRMMELWETESRGHLNEGKAMAAVCIVDMVAEHYQMFGRRSKLNALFQKKPEYLALITGSFACNRPDSGLRWRETIDHPVKFRLRCYVKGIATTTMRFFYVLLNKIPVIKVRIDKMRYPISM